MRSLSRRGISIVKPSGGQRPGPASKVRQAAYKLKGIPNGGIRLVAHAVFKVGHVQRREVRNAPPAEEGLDVLFVAVLVGLVAFQAVPIGLKVHVCNFTYHAIALQGFFLRCAAVMTGAPS